MRASLFRRRPVQLTRLSQKFIPSLGGPGSYTLTVDSLNIPVTFNAVTLTLVQNYTLTVDSLNIPVTFNAVNLVWVGAPVVLVKDSKFAMAMKIGF